MACLVVCRVFIRRALKLLTAASTFTTVEAFCSSCDERESCSYDQVYKCFSLAAGHVSIFLCVLNGSHTLSPQCEAATVIKPQSRFIKSQNRVQQQNPGSTIGKMESRTPVRHVFTQYNNYQC